MKRLIKWHRRRQFEKAYKVLRKMSDRHKQADHMMEFKAVNQSDILVRCFNCPNLEV